MASSERIFTLLDTPVTIVSGLGGHASGSAARDSGLGVNVSLLGARDSGLGRVEDAGPVGDRSGRGSLGLPQVPGEVRAPSAEPRAPSPERRAASPGSRHARSPGHLVFDHVWFAYNDEDYVLRDVSFEVRPGERVGVVGATGAGKSTLINLLLRFYDVSKGRILVDGVDIREMALDDLRSIFSLVLQDVHLFSGTIAGNIRLGRASITDDQVRQAAAAVHASAFIERLPLGYDSPVAERGATLSVGQKQLLSFARALAFDPRVLILDEATSSVDTETELLIRDALHILMAGRTTIAVAHRLSTIQNMDNILVLHRGTLRETGSHQQLLAQRGIYYKLYQLQYKDQESDDRGALAGASPDLKVGPTRS
jgi:ABC-type multidrug transport system fused ATPase/permease subunit